MKLFDDLPQTPVVKRGKHYVEPCGYVDIPGTGPDGETCGSCRHCVRMRQAKRWMKCGLNEARWTHGRATDILARSPACRKWEATPPTEKGYE